MLKRPPCAFERTMRTRFWLSVALGIIYRRNHVAIVMHLEIASKHGAAGATGLVFLEAVARTSVSPAGWSRPHRASYRVHLVAQLKGGVPGVVSEVPVGARVGDGPGGGDDQVAADCVHPGANRRG